MLIAELTKSCFFRDAVYPPGYTCRIATEDERSVFMSTKTGQMLEPVARELNKGGCIVYLNGKLRLLEKGSFQIISKSPAQFGLS